MSNASYWGCDIGGAGNTFLARIEFGGTSGSIFTTHAFPGSTVELARHVWTNSLGHSAPILLVVDAVLSYDLDSATGWRPAEKWLKSLLDRRLAMRPGASSLVSPNAFMGHRHLELAETLGAYFLVAETHPGTCLALMGAPLADIPQYKKDLAALNRLADWLRSRWFPSCSSQIRCDGELDALVCAMVAAAMGGRDFPGLSLFTPILGDPRDSTSLPRPSLAGPAPFYLLCDPQVYDMMIVEDVMQG